MLKIAVIDDNDELTVLLSQHCFLGEPAIFERVDKLEGSDEYKIIINNNSFDFEEASKIKWCEIIECKKPIFINDIISKVKSAYSKIKTDSYFKIASAKFFYNKKKVSIDSKEVILTDKEAEILMELVKSRPDSLTKEYLMQKLWHEDIDSHSLESHIYRLRKKLDFVDGFIITSEGGYSVCD